MNVKQLIDILQQYEPTTEVHIAYNAGDHWRTQVAPKITNVDELPVAHSDYHEKPILVDIDSCDDDSLQAVVVIS
jgi:hypothetical protein